MIKIDPEIIITPVLPKLSLIHFVSASQVPSLSSLSGRREFLTDTDDIESGYRSQNSTRVIKEVITDSFFALLNSNDTFVYENFHN